MALQKALGYQLGSCKLLLSLACATSAEQIQCNPESWEKLFEVELEEKEAATSKQENSQARG